MHVNLKPWQRNKDSDRKLQSVLNPARRDNLFFAGMLPNRFFELPYIKIGYNKKLPIMFPGGTITASPGKKSCKK